MRTGRLAARLFAAGVAPCLASHAFGQESPQDPSQGRFENSAQSTATATAFATARIRSAQGASKYEDVVTNRRFTLDRRGADVFLKFEDSPEVYVLHPNSAPRGDTVLRTDSGKRMLKVTELGNVISYLGNSNGAPVARHNSTAPLDAPAMTDSLAAEVRQTAQRLTRTAGHDVTIFGAGAFSGDERWASDALTVLTIGVSRAGKAAADLRSVRLVRAEEPGVRYDEAVGELVLAIDPSSGFAGRPSSDSIAAAVEGSLEP